MSRDPYKGFKIERIGTACYQASPERQSIRLPRRYTASREPTGEWYITNHLGRVLQKGSSLHDKITAACEFQYSGRETA